MPSTGPRRRSRFGCRNCKLRKLKCDESKPQCKKCTSFGLLCTFMSNTPEMQPVTADTGEELTTRGRLKLHIQLPITSAVWTADKSTTYQLNAKCQDFISRYLRESLMNPEDPNMRHVNRQLLRLAFTYPFLMHASLAVAFTYDRHLNPSSTSHHRLDSCYHWTQSTSLLNIRLRQPLPSPSTSTAQGTEKDAIWGTAAALAILTFSSPDASSPEQSWPLASSPSLSGSYNSPLNWLPILNGKMALWETVNPLRPDSIFSIMADTFTQMQAPLPGQGVDGIPSSLAAVCSLDEKSTATSNPYFEAAHAVSQILDIPDRDVTTGPVQLFVRSIYGPFEDLIKKRDPVALLLLYLWYSKAGRGIWWIGLRARVECPAIRQYLRLCYEGDEAVMAVLEGGGGLLIDGIGYQVI